MTRSIITGGVAAVLLVGLSAVYRALEQDVRPAAAAPPAALAPVAAAAEGHPGLLYGRVTTHDGASYQGRLRWGGDEEAFWDNYFNGFKDENRWAASAPLERLPVERRSMQLFGLEISRGERPVELGRPFMARFGDIARIEARDNAVRLQVASGVELDPDVRLSLESGVEFDPDVRVTLKSGAVFDLDRLSAGDFDDGVRVWDDTHGVVDLDARQIRAIEFLPTPRLPDAPGRIHGTVRTRQGDFTGFLQWNREEATGRDELVGRADGREVRVRFDAIRSIARRSSGSALVTLLDSREMVLSGTRHVGEGNRGIYVDDPRYGRVLVSWDGLERAELSPGGRGPAYADFVPGAPLAGVVTTRSGLRLAGRLVYDLDESETTETLDAPAGAVDYTIPFGRVASIVLPGDASSPARVTLRSGEQLRLKRAGDLGERNAGILVFAGGGERPEYVPWEEVGRIDLDPPSRQGTGRAVRP